MDLNHLLLDLEVIKQIKEDDKLAVIILPGSKKLSVDTSNYVSSITRWYNGYNRETSIAYLDFLTNSIEKTCEIVISGHHTNYGETIKNAINSSLSGLENLRNTYINDSVTNAKITLIINKLSTLSKNLDNFINNTLDFINNIENNNVTIPETSD